MGTTESGSPAVDGARPLVVFDGDCSVCIGIVRALARLRLVPAERARAFQELEAPLAERAWAAGVRNELVALEPGSGALRVGLPGVLWAIEGSWADPLARVAARRPLVDLLSVAYRWIAYNRRVLAPPHPRAVECACEPDFHAGYRAALVALLGAAAAALAFAAGSRSSLLPGSAVQRGLAALAVLGGGWPIAAALLRVPPGRRADAAGHLALIAFAGALALVPYAVVSASLARADLDGFALASVAAGAAVVATLLRRRARRARLGPAFARRSAAAVFGWSLAAAALLALA